MVANASKWMRHPEEGRQEQEPEEKARRQLSGEENGQVQPESELVKGAERGLQGKGEETFKEETSSSSPWGRMTNQVRFGDSI